MKEKNMNYESPLIEVVDVEVERGFAASTIGGSSSDWELGDTFEPEILNELNELNKLIKF